MSQAAQTGPYEDPWDALAEWVPESRREAYWRTVARLRLLRADDEVLLLIEAMGVVALVTADTPRLLAKERAAWSDLVQRTRVELDVLMQDTEARTLMASNALERASVVLECNAQKVEKGLLHAGENVNSQTISEQVARSLEARLIQPAEAAVRTMAETVAKLPGFLKQAQATEQFLKDFNLGWHYLNAVLAALVLAILFTVLIHRYAA